MIIVDEMLNDVSKWLRLFGIPTVYINGKKDEEILNSLKPTDTLITADEALYRRALKKSNAILITEKDKVKKVAKVIKLLHLSISLDKPRCPICGGELERVSKEKAVVPEKVKQNHTLFYYCPKCNKYYWKGSHWKRIERFYKAVKDSLH